MNPPVFLELPKPEEAMDETAGMLLNRVYVAVKMRHSDVDQVILNFERFMNAFAKFKELNIK